MITRAELPDAIRNSAGQCWCEFTKLDGTRRVMRFRFEPVGPIKGTGKPIAEGQIRVWDDDANGYRTITIARTHWVDLGAGKQEIAP
jgi:hypothetical protein